MEKHIKIGLRVHTETTDKGIITQKIISIYDKEEPKLFVEQIINTRDIQIIKSLIDLGWIPPIENYKHDYELKEREEGQFLQCKRCDKVSFEWDDNSPNVMSSKKELCKGDEK